MDIKTKLLEIIKYKEYFLKDELDVYFNSIGVIN